MDVNVNVTWKRAAGVVDCNTVPRCAIGMMCSSSSRIVIFFRGDRSQERSVALLPNGARRREERLG